MVAEVEVGDIIRRLKVRRVAIKNGVRAVVTTDTVGITKKYEFTDGWKRAKARESEVRSEKSEIRRSWVRWIFVDGGSDIGYFGAPVG